MARTALVVLNPTAGNHRTGRLRGRIERAFEATAMDVRFSVTEGPRHAVELARDATEALVVAAGGDGTVQEVAAGLVAQGGRSALGVLPLGTGNDFARLTGIPRSIEAAAQQLADAALVPLDVIGVRWREAPEGAWFEGVCVNALGVGFDALVAAEAARFKRLPGKGAYLTGIVTAWRTWPRPAVRIERLDGGHRLTAEGALGEPVGEGVLHEGPFFLADLGNGRTVGGGLRFTPVASAADGHMDVVLVSELSLARLPTLLPKVMRGTHLGEPEVVAERLRGLRVTSEEPLPLHFDGEVLTQSACEVEARVRPHALRAAVAPDSVSCFDAGGLRNETIYLPPRPSTDPPAAASR